MKPQSIMQHERMDIDTTLQSKKMSIDTPIGKIESDSGSHIIDVLSIVIIIAAFYYFKRLFSTAKN